MKDIKDMDTIVDNASIALTTGEDISPLIEVCMMGRKALEVVLLMISRGTSITDKKDIRISLGRNITEVKNQVYTDRQHTLALAAVMYMTSIYDSVRNNAARLLSSEYFAEVRNTPLVLSVIKEYYARTGEWVSTYSDDEFLRAYFG